LNAVVTVVSTQYYTNVQLTSADGKTTVSVYCKSAAQYAFLESFAGQVITIEIAACNWNNKKHWVGCVLAVRLPDGTKVLNTLNFN
jgi:hypothetical protein